MNQSITFYGSNQNFFLNIVPPKKDNVCAIIKNNYRKKILRNLARKAIAGYFVFRTVYKTCRLGDLNQNNKCYDTTQHFPALTVPNVGKLLLLCP
jgi:hypothetical protein